MYWTEEITLMQDKPEKKQGVLVHSYTPVCKVYGERKSVGWREFFAAEAAGTTLSAVFVLNADEYNGERVLLWKGSLYSVQRAYETGSTVELVRHPSTWILPHGQAAAVFDGACRWEHTGPERWRKAPPIPCRWQTRPPRSMTCGPPARHTTALTQYSAGRSPAALPAARSAVHCSRDPLFCSTGLTTWLTQQILQWALDCVPGGQMTHTAKKVYYNID